LQSAVSQNCILRVVAVPTVWTIERPADCKSAIQQITNLRYKHRARAGELALN
jgi:hypothetical protein